VCKGQLGLCFSFSLSNKLRILFEADPVTLLRSTDWWRKMQDNAKTHVANSYINALHEVFGEQVISWGLWPPQSPDLNPCDFYLWSTLKEKVYVNNTHPLEELQEKFRHEISAITVEQLRRVSGNIFWRQDSPIKLDMLNYSRKVGLELSATMASLCE
jgi:hypothetical protein